MAQSNHQKLWTFGRFKIETADKLQLQDTKKLAMIFELPERRVDEIERSENSGIAFLNILENGLQIGPDIGIDALLGALRRIELHKVASFADEKFREFKTSKSTFASEPSLQQESDVAVKNRKTQKTLLFTLRDELTKKDCFEVATYLGWPAGVVENIRLSDHDRVECLVNSLYDRHANISQVDLLLHALNDCGLARVGKLIESSIDESGNHRTIEEDIIKDSCICGNDAFEELKSVEDGELLCLHCLNCSADWISAGSHFSGRPPRIHKYGKTFIYKVPIRVVLSDLKRESITRSNDLTPGDHIAFRVASGLFHHHAIYLSTHKDQVEIVHWTFGKFGESLKGMIGLSDEKFITIKREYKPFPYNGVSRVIYDGRDDPSPLVLARALQMLHKTDERYNIMQNNCENLAMYCKVGKGFSMQGERAKDIHPRYHHVG